MSQLNLMKLHVPRDLPLASALTQFAGVRTFIVDPDDETLNASMKQVETNDTFVDATTIGGIVNADVVIIDRWDDCTRTDQQRMLKHLSLVCRHEVPIVLRYVDMEAFQHDGLSHPSFGVKN